MENKKSPELLLKIYLLYHDAFTKKLAETYAARYSFFQPFELQPSKYLESSIFFYIANNPDKIKNYKYIGFMASTFERKAKFIDFERMIELSKNKDIDIFGLGLNLTNIANDVIHHCNIYSIFDKTLQHFKLKANLHENIPCFYYNYFIAKSEKVLNYCIFMNQVKQFWETDDEMKSLLLADATYKEGKQSVESMIKNFGVPYYTHEPFCAERMIGLYASLSNWKISSPEENKYQKLYILHNCVVIPYPDKVLSAKYGFADKTFDVLDLIERELKKKARAIKVINDLFNDPYEGVVKLLELEYMINGEKKTCIVNENDWLYILYRIKDV